MGSPAKMGRICTISMSQLTDGPVRMRLQSIAHGGNLLDRVRKMGICSPENLADTIRLCWIEIPSS
jgi:hypothetical protein